MLRLSKLADYGTVVMVYLARNTQRLANAREIAAMTHITVPMVSKLLKKLTSAGLLNSERGVNGGYRLNRPAARISVAQIIFALEDYQGMTECSIHKNACSLESVCHLQGNWRLINKAITSALDSLSLESLAKPTLQTVDIQRLQKIASGATGEQ